MLGTLNKYKLLAVLAVAILAIAIPVTIIQVQKQQEIRQRASPSAVSLEFAPNTITKSINDSFSVDINLINTDSPKDISAVDMTINYSNSSILESITFQPSQGFDPVINDTFQNSTHYVAIVPPTGSSMNGAAIRIGTLTFKGKSSGTENITFGNIMITASGTPDALAIDSSNNNSKGTYTITSTTTTPPAPTSNAPTATSVPGSKPCTENGNWCSVSNPGANDSTKGTCQQASGFYCNVSWDNCWSCTVKSPTPGSTSPYSGRPYSSGSSQPPAVPPTYSPGATSIPAGYVTLYFNVTLPGISPTWTTIPITVTMYQGSSHTGPFSNISLARQTSSDVFTGDSGTKIRASDIISSQDYYVEVKAQSYQKKIITGGEQKNPQGLRTLGNNYSLPAIKLLPGDINDDGAINGADYSILVACFGSKNVPTGSTDCANKTQSGKSQPDINKDGQVNGIDINLLWRGANGIY